MNGKRHDFVRWLPEPIRNKLELSDERMFLAAAGTGGFDLELTGDSGDYVTQLGAYHDHFETFEDALDLFYLGLLPSTEIHVHFAGSFAYKWQLYIEDCGTLRHSATFGLPIYPFWRKRSIEIRRNHWLEGYEELLTPKPEG